VSCVHCVPLQTSASTRLSAAPPCIRTLSVSVPCTGWCPLPTIAPGGICKRQCSITQSSVAMLGAASMGVGTLNRVSCADATSFTAAAGATAGAGVLICAGAGFSAAGTSLPAVWGLLGAVLVTASGGAAYFCACCCEDIVPSFSSLELAHPIAAALGGECTRRVGLGWSLKCHVRPGWHAHNHRIRRRG
jgi:hypothetical protein